MTEDVKVWNVLIVDDEPDMLAVTRMVLDDFEFLGRRVVVHEAQNAAACKRKLDEIPDIAVALLDVVMEEEDTGFKLIRHIREERRNTIIRLIIRTGQPGKAPLMEAVSRYDINDYKEKTELSIEKLRVTLMTALRSWQQMREIEQNRLALHHFVEKNPMLFRTHTLKQFAGTVLEQLKPLLALWNPEGCNDMLFAMSTDNIALEVQDGTGVFALRHGLPPELPEPFLQEILHTDRIRFHDDGITIQVGSTMGINGYLHLRGQPMVNEWISKLIQVFIASVSAAFDNLLLRRENEATQRELILNLGELLEARSGETVFHVHRVAAIARLLAQHSGVDARDRELIGMAAAFHDIGKIVVPEFILNKRGALTRDELVIMREHALTGKAILSKSNLPLFRIAAIMAAQHHERYDGTGYPEGLKGKEIHRYGRILALADVYDALGHDRVYKQAWPEEDVKAYIDSQRGKHFDPELVDLFFSLYDRIQEINRRDWSQESLF